MLPEKPKAYQSYLLRCWLSPETQSGDSSTGRFIVERVSGRPHRWGFNTFEELMAFLRVELLREQENQDETKKLKT